MIHLALSIVSALVIFWAGFCVLAMIVGSFVGIARLFTGSYHAEADAEKEIQRLAGERMSAYLNRYN